MARIFSGILVSWVERDKVKQNQAQEYEEYHIPRATKAVSETQHFPSSDQKLSLAYFWKIM